MFIIMVGRKTLESRGFVGHKSGEIEAEVPRMYLQFNIFSLLLLALSSLRVNLQSLFLSLCCCVFSRAFSQHQKTKNVHKQQLRVEYKMNFHSTTRTRKKEGPRGIKFSDFFFCSSSLYFRNLLHSNWKSLGNFRHFLCSSAHNSRRSSSLESLENFSLLFSNLYFFWLCFRHSSESRAGLFIHPWQTSSRLTSVVAEHEEKLTMSEFLWALRAHS